MANHVIWLLRNREKTWEGQQRRVKMTVIRAIEIASFES